MSADPYKALLDATKNLEQAAQDHVVHAQALAEAVGVLCSHLSEVIAFRDQDETLRLERML